ncbi:IS30 family transposase [Actinoplanes sp. NPDC049599]|uniref:IS30 family transposase n=1 Tax=Actinoplanes sp. NPDC049599 TaxID=3363903 RepID=UPI0037A9935B
MPRPSSSSPSPSPSPSSGSSRYLSQDERLLIADRRREKVTIRAIAAELGRAPSTISREITRNSTPRTSTTRTSTPRTSTARAPKSSRGRDYRPYAAQARADARRPRPKTRKIHAHPRLREFIQTRLDLRWSPEQICHALLTDFPDPAEKVMRVAPETIYQAIYVQARGQLRRDLTTALRTGRARRKPRRQAQQRHPRFIEPMLMISERPAEAEDRAVPGHWEGDLIIGKNNGSAIGTLVERQTRYVMLLHLPTGRATERVRDALVQTIQTLPAHLTRSLTWDQGNEMSLHGQFTIATGVPVYFCDPHSPWQRGSNENTNGLLRQYFPKGTDLATHTRQHLDAVAAELNARPRKTLDWDTPAQRLHKLLTP